MESSVISGKTGICGIIGDPVEHSMSPLMQNAAFRRLGLDYLYVPFRVRRELLDRALEGVRALNIRGLNVTTPHKVAVMSLLDEIDPLAKRIGAVNTVVNDDGVLSGYNTDAAGFLRALLEKDIEPRGRNVVILGAGGASRAVSLVLAERGSRILVLNRTLDRAKEVANRVSGVSRNEVRALELDRDNLSGALGEADILVNTTSVGMSPNTGESPVASDLLRSSLVVFDIVYSPVRTKLLKEAEEAGALAVSGLDMLVWQGAIAFEKWTGLAAPSELMKEEVARAVAGDEN
ncbi:MAG: shikimate dehydrogenase [Dehalococcoidia bacterium]|nr:shikimate dehydrogenase [Dehalococcoidia bacterium]